MELLPYLLNSLQILGISIPETIEKQISLIERSDILTILPTVQAEIVSTKSQLAVPQRCSICQRLITKHAVGCRYDPHIAFSHSIVFRIARLFAIRFVSIIVKLLIFAM